MAVPTTTALTSRVPAGIKLKDGIKSVFAFNRAPTFSLWEKTAKMGKIDNGAPIVQTTMYNTTYETKAPQLLNDIDNATFKAAFDPNWWNQLTNILGRGNEGSITRHYPDGSYLDFYGYLKSIDEDALERGKQPEATCEIVVTNWDPVNNVEQGPVLTSVANT